MGYSSYNLAKRFGTYRLDATKIRIDSRGFARIPAAFTRAGVVNYRGPDGEVIRELRRPETVKASAESLAGAPLTLGHRQDAQGRYIEITAENAKEHAVGLAGDRFDSEGDLLVGEVVLTDAGTINKVKRGELAELSTGMFHVEIDPTPGEYNGQRYDQEQVAIVHNHVAIGPRGWNRNGPDVSLRLDSADAIEIETNQETYTMTTKIRLDGRDVEVADKDVEFLQSLADKAAKLDDLAKERDTVQARLDAADSELEKLRSVDVDKAVRARVALERHAHEILGDKAPRLDGLSDREVKLAVVKHVRGDVPAERMDSEAYVDASFDIAVEQHAEARKSAAKAGEVTRVDRGDDEPAGISAYEKAYFRIGENK